MEKNITKKCFLLLFQNLSFNIKEYTSHYPFLSIMSILGYFKEPREDYPLANLTNIPFFNFAKMASKLKEVVNAFVGKMTFSIWHLQQRGTCDAK